MTNVKDVNKNDDHNLSFTDKNKMKKAISVEIEKEHDEKIDLPLKGDNMENEKYQQNEQNDGSPKNVESMEALKSSYEKGEFFQKRENEISEENYVTICNKNEINEKKEMNYFKNKIHDDDNNNNNINVHNTITNKNNSEGTYQLDSNKNIFKNNLYNKNEEENVKHKKENPTFLEIQFKKSLLENENIKRNISAKNFYIIEEDMLINITIILDRIIEQLIIYYKEKDIDIDEQIVHFQNVFKVLYKLLSNISFHPNEEKYKTIKLRNIQVKNTFLINDDIYNLIKLLFDILNFNTDYSYIKLGQDYVNKINVDIINNSECTEFLWKFHKEFNDKDAILFEYVLSSVKIIMNSLNKDITYKYSNSIEKNETKKNYQLNIDKYNKTDNLIQDQKRSLENLSNIANLSLNNKINIINQKKKEQQQALSDIRKIHNERYKVHKTHGESNTNLMDKNKNKNKNIYNKKNGHLNKNNTHNMYNNNKSYDNEYDDSDNSNDRKNFKNGKKKIKHFFKNFFKKN
ncbi:hypothetical protein PFTANZ_02141 [Plasmodium falciparum Tanzania (2000708)]|uniref:PUB domain-containing protein n=1 Tax=Plasmodium falciparum Tanzania (2000708) TaxID=1036725 RepID=A0A024W991_PLAFA|nr:hypothetical protein PFTANZ_02141 [Plasmodium falciparum Tanzania (2000708)]